MPKVLRQENRRVDAGLDRRNMLDEPALWSRHRYVAQEGIREPCDCGVPCAIEDRQQVVAPMGNDGRRDQVRERAATVSWCRGWSKISFRDSDFQGG